MKFLIFASLVAVIVMVNAIENVAESEVDKCVRGHATEINQLGSKLEQETEGKSKEDACRAIDKYTNAVHEIVVDTCHMDEESFQFHLEKNILEPLKEQGIEC